MKLFKRYPVLNIGQIEYERSDTHRVEKNKQVKEMRMFGEGYEENVMKKVVSNPMLRNNMMYATELRTGRPATSQLFLFAKQHILYVCDAIQTLKVCICTTIFVPPLNNCGYDIILIPQFILLSFHLEGAMGHFILNIVDMKEKCVHRKHTERD